MPFEVEVISCEATLDASNAILPSRSIVWGDEVLPYNIGSVFGQYVQSPDCGYDILFDILFEDLTNNPGVLIPAGDSESPPEIIYSSAQTTFFIEKCS